MAKQVFKNQGWQSFWFLFILFSEFLVGMEYESIKEMKTQMLTMSICIVVGLFQRLSELIYMHMYTNMYIY